MSPYAPREYWAGVAENFRSADSSGLAPVLHPGAPAWFNQLIDDLQFKAVRRALKIAQIPPRSRILDVGCGTGRWVRRYEQLGLRPTGLDATPGMLRIARRHSMGAALSAGEAHRLPFADAVFDGVSDVTVVQHIPTAAQPEAISEMMRVLKPGGCLILMELIRGTGLHIFPRAPQDWIQVVTSSGSTLVGWFGQEFLLPDRLLSWTVTTLTSRRGNRPSAASLPTDFPSQNSSAFRRAYWGLRHITAPLSAWIDPVTEKVSPARFATHGVFVFRK
jgi:SAM-dependent methyltransferase